MFPSAAGEPVVPFRGPVHTSFDPCVGTARSSLQRPLAHAAAAAAAAAQQLVSVARTSNSKENASASRHTISVQRTTCRDRIFQNRTFFRVRLLSNASGRPAWVRGLLSLVFGVRCGSLTVPLLPFFFHLDPMAAASVVQPAAGPVTVLPLGLSCPIEVKCLETSAYHNVRSPSHGVRACLE
jgi:hypothetical protein